MRILIEVSGGMVIQVTLDDSPGPVEVLLAHYDCLEDGEPFSRVPMDCATATAAQLEEKLVMIEDDYPVREELPT
jgi:hypothetical protein